MNRLALYAALVVLGLSIWGGSIGAAYLRGLAVARGEAKLAATEAERDAQSANLAVDRAVADATGSLAAENNRLSLELRHAERELRRFETRAPAPGTVGASALVDPDLGRAFLCRIRRLRADPTLGSDECPRDDADAGATGR